MPMHARNVFGFLCVAFLVAPLAVPSLAQTETATLSGRIVDPSGAVVPDAEVEATNIDTGIAVVTRTNEDGLYVIPHLRPGKYRLIVRKEGFQTIIKADLVLNVQAIVAQNFSLQVGSVTQSITVMGGAPLLNTSDPSVGTVINREFVENLPLNGRSFHTLLQLTPGIVMTPSSQFSRGQFSTNGNRPNTNYYTIDGASANFGSSADFFMGEQAGGGIPAFSAFGGTSNLISLDALQEFRIQTSNFAPEFGRTPGAEVSLVSRSGTNVFHGLLFEYFRNDALDAADWFANRDGLPKAALRMNTFGGTFGGPLWRNRTFFFFSYEGSRLRTPRTEVAVVPSQDARLAAPATIRPLLEAYPLPNGPALSSVTARFTAAFSIPSSSDAYSVRLDHDWKKWRLFGRSNIAPSEIIAFGRGGFNELPTTMRTVTHTVGATLLLSSNAIADFRWNWSRSVADNFGRVRAFEGSVPPTDSALFPSFTSSAESSTSVTISGLPAYVVGKQVENVQRQVNFVGALTLVKGSHRFKPGLDYRRLRPTFGVRPYNTSLFFTSVNQALTGAPLLTSINARDTQLEFVFHNVSLYAQDTWTATQRLSVTYGVRWEYNPPPSEEDGKLPFTVIGLGDPATMSLAPQGTRLWNAEAANVAPRVGLTYALSERLGMVVRGGFGIFYDLGNGPALLGTSTWPYSRVRNFFFRPWPLDSASAEPPPFSLAAPYGELSVADPNLKLPYTRQWNIALEKAIGSSQSLSVTYIGQAGRRLLRRELLTQPNPDFTQVKVTRNASSSDYHAMQVQFRRPLSRGLQVLASYSWAHSIDDFSNDQFFDVPAALINLDSIRRASSDFDVRHSFNAAITYELPSPSAGLASAILRNFVLDTIVRAHTALPLDVFAGFDALEVRRRPNLVPGQQIWIKEATAPEGKRLNPDAFVLPGPNEFGDLGRNSLRGFGLSQVDFAIRRDFGLSESVKLQVRTDFFNIFNHPNFADPVTELGNPLFGYSTRMRASALGGGTSGGLTPIFQIGGPRDIQIALRLSF